jgi:hypothetical protein
MHGVAVLFGRAVALGVTKSVSFEEKKNLMLDLKIIIKMLKIKKNRCCRFCAIACTVIAC